MMASTTTNRSPNGDGHVMGVGGRGGAGGDQDDDQVQLAMLAPPPSFSSFVHAKGSASSHAGPSEASKRKGDGVSDEASTSTSRHGHREQGRHTERKEHGEHRHSRRAPHERRGVVQGGERVHKERHAHSHRHGDHDTKHDHRSHRAPSHRHRGEETLPATRQERSPPASPPPHSHNDVYVRDTTGDRLSAKYGAADPYKVPKYRRAGAGRVVGLPPEARIVAGDTASKSAHAFSSGVEIAFGAARRGKRGRDAAMGGGGEDAATALPGLKKVKARVLRPKATLDHAAGFVPLRDQPLSTAGTAADLFRPLTPTEARPRPPAPPWPGDGGGGADDRDDDNDDGGDVSDDDGVESSPFEAANARAVELDRHVRDEPTDVEAWLRLADIQDRLADEGGLQALGDSGVAAAHADSRLLLMPSRRASRRSERDDARRRLALDNVKLSILERARRSLPADVRVLVTLLSLASASGAWDAAKLEAEWRRELRAAERRALRDAATETALLDLAELWLAYLRWRLGDWSTFDLDAVVACLAEANEALVGAMLWDEARASAESDSRERAEVALVALFELACIVLHEAGLAERAFGLVQAQCELTWAPPAGLDRPSSMGEMLESLDALERFWDGEAPRLGESGARGWAAWVEQGERCDGVAPPGGSGVDGLDFDGGAAPPAALADPDPATRWLALTRAREKVRCRPARLAEEAHLMTGEVEVDPFAFVLFDDVRALLVPLCTERGRTALLDRILCFLHLPAGLDARGMASFDAVHRLPSNVDLLDRFWPSGPGVDGEAGATEEGADVGLADPFREPVKSYFAGLDALFPDSSDAAASPGFCRLERAEVGPTTPLVEAAALLLDQLAEVARVTSERLPMLRLALTSARLGHRAAVKLAKSMLASEPHRVPLWAAYAQMEKRQGRVDAARRVYQNAVTITSSSRDPVGGAAAEGNAHVGVGTDWLWQAWVELEWEAGRPDAALCVATLACVSALGPAKGEEQHSVLAQLGSGHAQVPRPFSVDLLKARRVLASIVTEEACTSPRWLNAVCIAAIVDLTAHGLEAMQDGISRAIERAQGCDDECLRDEVAVRLSSLLHRCIRRHRRRGPGVGAGGGDGGGGRTSFRPAAVRSIVFEALRLSPTNTATLAMLAAYEGGWRRLGNGLRLALQHHSLAMPERGERAFLLRMAGLRDEAEAAATATTMATAPQGGEGGATPSRRCDGTGTKIESMPPPPTAERRVGALVFAIYAELHLSSSTTVGGGGGGVVNPFLVRRLFERTLRDAAVRCDARASAWIWRLYVDFESRVASSLSSSSQKPSRRPTTGAHDGSEAPRRAEEAEVAAEGKREAAEERRRRREARRAYLQAARRAKGVATRALRACPFVKELYLAHFGPPLRDVATRDELLDVGRMMEEKRLRVHVGLDVDGFLVDVADEGENDEGVDEDEDEDDDARSAGAAGDGQQGHDDDDDDDGESEGNGEGRHEGDVDPAAESGRLRRRQAERELQERETDEMRERERLLPYA